uniref:Cytochrome P450 n=1 Tax=Arion vulgaris TaxID=1028688 RepID=A0A0B7AKA1_9EUPU
MKITRRKMMVTKSRTRSMLMSSVSGIYVVFLVAVVVFLIVFLWIRRVDPRLPPSPMRPLPVVGHLFSMACDSRPQFSEWRQRCGDIFTLRQLCP